MGANTALDTDDGRSMSLICFGDLAALLTHNAEVEGSSPSLTTIGSALTIGLAHTIASAGLLWDRSAQTFSDASINAPISGAE
jgi:hypothetical protein